MHRLWPIHTVVFDLDDTLYAEREFVLSGFQAVDAWLQTDRGIAGFSGAAEKVFSAGQRGKIFDEVLPVLGVEATAGLVKELVGIYREHEPTIELFPDALEVLAWADPAFNLGLITDGYAAVQARKIRALGLEPRIRCRIISDELGRACWKPSIEPYNRVMAHYPGPVGGFVYVADNPRKDFIGARQLGWRTVRVRRAGGEHHRYEASVAEAADVEIASLRELRRLIVQMKS